MSRRKSVAAPEKTAAIYARFSSRNQRDESIDAQLRACHEYANRNGLQVVEVYTDSAKTGTNAEREGFLRMVEDSGKGLFRNLIIHKLDRFSRSKHDAVIYKRKLKVNGVRIFSVTENLDDSPESTILESLLEGMAQYYSQNLSREVMKGMKESAYKCLHLGGIPPLGYDVDPATRTYVINEPEAFIVRIIFEKYADGVGYNQILNFLNGSGYRTKRGKAFGKNSLHSILSNEKYVGRYTFNKMLEKDVTGKRSPQKRDRKDWIIVEGGLPAIIDEETFAKVQSKMAHNLKNGGRFKAQEVYLLSGLLYCGECGFSMTGNTRSCGRGKTRYASYRCSNRANHKGCVNREIPKDSLESFVLDELYHTLLSEHSIRKLAAMLNDYHRKKTTESSEELCRFEKELTNTNKEIGKIIELVSVSGLSIETVKDALKQLEEKKLFIEDRIRDITLSNNASLISEDKIYELIDRSRGFVRTKNIAECRNFIEAYVEKVLVYGERVEVKFKIHVPDSNGESASPLRSGDRIKSLQKEYRHAV